VDSQIRSILPSTNFQRGLIAIMIRIVQVLSWLIIQFGSLAFDQVKSNGDDNDDQFGDLTASIAFNC
jgi:hypothetical protein